MVKRFLILLAAVAWAFSAPAQTRTYADNESGTFVFGLQQYYFGDNGQLDFDGAVASVENGKVMLDGKLLEGSGVETLIGLHDFTDSGKLEVIVARRNPSSVSAAIYSKDTGQWKLIGEMRAGNAKDIRVFRQVLSIREGDTLHSWTWHGGKFDHKSNLQ